MKNIRVIVIGFITINIGFICGVGVGKSIQSTIDINLMCEKSIYNYTLGLLQKRLEFYILGVASKDGLLHRIEQIKCTNKDYKNIIEDAFINAREAIRISYSGTEEYEFAKKLGDFQNEVNIFLITEEF